MSADPFRVYEPDEYDPKTGYPFAWTNLGDGVGVKDLVRELAGHRCVRCGHPYRTGEHGNGEWSACDVRCSHAGRVRILVPEGDAPFEAGEWMETTLLLPFTVGGQIAESGQPYEAAWRILTVHHLDGDKANLRGCVTRQTHSRIESRACGGSAS